jgi:hypothetical protein
MVSGINECGSRNAECGKKARWMSDFHNFRIPHSDFRIQKCLTLETNTM